MEKGYIRIYNLETRGSRNERYKVFVIWTYFGFDWLCIYDFTGQQPGRLRRTCAIGSRCSIRSKGLANGIKGVVELLYENVVG